MPFLKGLAECLKVGNEGSTWSLHQSSCIKEEQNISACLLSLLPWAQKKGALKAGSHHHFYSVTQWPISQVSQKAQSPDWRQNTTTRAPVCQGAMLVRKIEPMTWPPWWPHWGLPWWLVWGNAEHQPFWETSEWSFPSQSIIYLPCTSKQGFPGSSDGKESSWNTGDLGLIPGSGRSPGEGNGNPFQYSCLENPMVRGARRATVHGGHKESDMTERLTLSLDFAFVLVNYPEAVSTILLFKWVRPLFMMCCGCHITGVWMDDPNWEWNCHLLTHLS